MNTISQLDDWRAKMLEQWKDSRIVSADYVDLWVWMWCHSYADFAQIGADLCGVSFREKQGDWLMTIKAVVGEVPSVAFVSSQDTTHCVRKLRGMLRDGGVRWYPDKYA